MGIAFLLRATRGSSDSNEAAVSRKRYSITTRDLVLLVSIGPFEPSPGILFLAFASSSSL